MSSFRFSLWFLQALRMVGPRALVARVKFPRLLALTAFSEVLMSVLQHVYHGRAMSIYCVANTTLHTRTQTYKFYRRVHRLADKFTTYS